METLAIHDVSISQSTLSISPPPVELPIHSHMHHSSPRDPASIPLPADTKDMKSSSSRSPLDGTGADSSHQHIKPLPMRTREDAVPFQDTAERKHTANFLDLPVELLGEIVKQVPHTNDLCALAVAHSKLHNAVISQIYSRFDIVWPEVSSNIEPRAGVDALTYGLATLVMAEDVYGEATWQTEKAARQASESMSMCSSRAGQESRTDTQSETQIRRRRGNHYASNIRKFSLGNGPRAWVEEYLTNKEQGKMLGTLVALAIARMRKLETFVWDMPTGILRDVWTSLSYLGDFKDCRLDSVWIRWHDNTIIHQDHTGLPPPPGERTSPQPGQPHHSLDRVEHPNFSELPALKNLSVLDIDEIQYLDEMSVLIERSLDKLRELRVGLSEYVKKDDWTRPWEGDDYNQIDYSDPTRSSATIGEKRLGGVLGVLTGRFHDLKQRNPPRLLARRLRRRSSVEQLSQASSASRRRQHMIANQSVASGVESGAELDTGLSIESDIKLVAESNTEPGIDQGAQQGADSGTESITELGAESGSPSTESPGPECSNGSIEPPVRESSISSPSLEDEEYIPKLRLNTLELERVPLHLPVLENALDWSRLTSLTLLDCPNHDQLWKALRTKFAPADSPALSTRSLKSPRHRRQSSGLRPEPMRELCLKKIHTNTPTPSLIAFIKDALPADTLEAFYLQDLESESDVDIETIFRGVIKRHRLSLRKLYIESCGRSPEGNVMPGTWWKKWALNAEMIKFVTSKMPHLRELGVCIDYRKDWHYFLQRLPSMPQLRSLYIPRYKSYDNTSEYSPKELAMSVLDIIVLRPEIELCYLGLMSKCFEIQEGIRDLDGRMDGAMGVDAPEDEGDTEDGGEDEEDDDDDEDDEADEEDATADMPTSGLPGRPSEDEDSDSGSEVEDERRKLRLREILFYDDKVSIFKCRHGRL